MFILLSPLFVIIARVLTLFTKSLDSLSDSHACTHSQVVMHVSNTFKRRQAPQACKKLSASMTQTAKDKMEG